ncbi:NACHT domain-containing protein [Micromonospora sp. WMMD730]|uniref:NACHT domain-containing protein n=1 Tax=Micromonospora sp. WMMD730 TaxID=3404128 RepID=UPI003B943876
MTRIPTPLARFWMNRSSSDRNVVRPSDANQLSLADAVTGRCTVLLAPPGAGKTVELRSLVKSLGERARFITLGTYGDLHGKITRALAELSPYGAEGLLALDSMDESTLPTTQLANLIEDVVTDLPEGLRLVLACRTAAWLPGVNQVLHRALGDDVTVLDLIALTEHDVVTFADAFGVSGQEFFEAVTTAKATPLTRHPKELEFLLDEYKAAGDALPSTQRELYDRAIDRLCKEQNPHRQVAGDTGEHRALREGAGRLAVLSLFTTRKRFRLHEPVDEFSLSEDDYASLLPETPVPAPYPSVLGTALFEGAADGTLKFTHQTVAEYLAARHLSNLKLTKAQLDALLRVPGGLLAPQVQAVAAWLIALDPGRFEDLLDDDPAAFIGSQVELTDPEFRQSLLRRLLALADDYSLDEAVPLDLSGLTYPGIEELARLYLTDRDRSLDARYLALRIVSDNQLVGLNDVLVGLAMSEDEPIVLRNAAGRRSLDLVPPKADTPLGALADRADDLTDEDDDLLGVGLFARLRSGTSPSELLRYLKKPANPDLFGSYWAFASMELPKAMSASALTIEEVRESVQWLARLDRRDRPGMPRVSGRPVCPDALQDAIVEAGLLHCQDVNVRDDVARLIRLCLTEDRKLLRKRSLPALPDKVRRSLLLQVIGTEDDVVLAWGLVRSSLLQADDLLWVTQLLDARIEQQPHTMRAWLLGSVDPSRDDHRETIETIDASSPAYRWLNPWPGPEELPTTAELVAEGPGPTEAQLHDRLIETLAGEPADAFARFCYWAHFETDRPVAEQGLEIDVRALPGWKYLNDVEHRQVVRSADRYLHAGTDNGESLVGTDQFSTAALAGVRAFALINAERGTVELPAERWAFWAPALIHTPRNGGESLLLTSLRCAFDQAGEAFRVAAEREMQIAPEFAQFVLQRLMPALESDAIEWLTALADDPASTDAAASVAFSRLIVLDPDNALSRIAENMEPTARFRRFAATALEVVGSRAWHELRDRLQQDTETATAVLGDLAASHAFDTDAFAEADLVALWELMYDLFPPDEDPNVSGAHWIGPRETIGHERDRMLPALAQRGTSEAVAVLADLATRRSDHLYLRRLVARARAALARADWHPLRPNEVRLALLPARRVLRNEVHLLAMVIEALQHFQDDVLQGMSPLATLLWDHRKCGATPPMCRPKSEDEISDLVDHQIRTYLPGVIVNREVQIRRLKPTGIGQRSDLLVQAQATGDTSRIIRVVIEVKGCWNGEVSDALETQLVERYLNPIADAAGLFLVAWFDSGHGFRAGTWKNDPIRGNRDALFANLEERAKAAAEPIGRSIRAIVIDCSMPTQEARGVEPIDASQPTAGPSRRS